MVKSKYLISLVFIGIISGCGFHPPYKNDSINAYITGQSNSQLATKLSRRFNNSLKPSLTVQITSESKRTNTGSFDSNGKESGYNLVYSALIKVFDSADNQIFEKEYTTTTYIKKLSSSQADRGQIEKTFERLTDSVVRKFIRQINRL